MIHLALFTVSTALLLGGPEDSGPVQPSSGPVLTSPSGALPQTPQGEPVAAGVTETRSELESAEQRLQQLAEQGVPSDNPNSDVIERVRARLKRLRQLLQKEAQRGAGSEPSAPAQEDRTTSGANVGTRAETADGDSASQPSGQDAEQQGQPAEPAEPAEPAQAPGDLRDSVLPTPVAGGQSELPGSTPVPQESPGATAQADQPVSVPLLDRPVDPLAAARSCLRAGQYRDALAYYRMVDIDRLDPETRHWVFYEQAMCWKMLGDLERASTLYREVASRASDPRLREACQWQLESLRWRQQLRGVLEETNVTLDSQGNGVTR